MKTYVPLFPGSVPTPEPTYTRRLHIASGHVTPISRARMGELAKRLDERLPSHGDIWFHDPDTMYTHRNDLSVVVIYEAQNGTHVCLPDVIGAVDFIQQLHEAACGDLGRGYALSTQQGWAADVFVSLVKTADTTLWMIGKPSVGQSLHATNSTKEATQVLEGRLR